MTKEFHQLRANYLVKGQEKQKRSRDRHASK